MLHQVKFPLKQQTKCKRIQKMSDVAKYFMEALSPSHGFLNASSRFKESMTQPESRPPLLAFIILSISLNLARRLCISLLALHIPLLRLYINYVFLS
ncbi:hypothetical protein PS15p_203154 [Mucor circinelloides]